MNASILRQLLVVASVVWFMAFAAGCTTVVRPLSASDPISPDKNQGLILGHVQLAWHGSNTSPGLTQPVDMKWSLEEETQGKRTVIAGLPTAGPFMVRLPVGSYRVKDISFKGVWGTWHTVLPTTFQVQAGGCTSLGTWELQRETESFADWITGHVFKDLDETHVELQEVLTTQDCSASAHSPGRSKLGFQNRHGGSEF